MTKKIFMAALMLISAMSMQAQSLIGKWQTKMAEGDQEINIFFNFTQTKLDMSIAADMSDPEVGKISVSAQVPCTYTVAGDKLTVKPTSNDVSLNIDKIDFVPEIKAVLDQNPDLKQQLMDQMKTAMNGQKGEILNELPSNGVLTIVSNTGTKLTLRDETGEEVVLTKM